MFLWYFSQTISPLLLIADVFMKAHKISYFITAYFYILQLYLNLSDFKVIDEGNYILPAFYTCVLTVITVYHLKPVTKHFVKREIKKSLETLMNE